MKLYQHLGKEERFYIWQALREGKTQKQVAIALGRHPSTICREVKRNTYRRCHMYTYHWALQIVRYRQQRVNRHKARKLTDEFASLII